MLINLTISNFIIIENISVDLTRGLTAMTGETGAGKSIILSALSIALGKKISKDSAKIAQKPVEISICVDIASLPKVQTWLEDYDFIVEDELIIRRVLTPEGRTKNYLNNSIIGVNQLQELTKQLITIHGQQENQLLLNKNIQLHILDSYASNNTLCQQIQNTYTQWKQINNEISLLENSDDSSAKVALLEFQTQELNAVKELIENLQELESRHSLLSNAEEIKHSLLATVSSLDNDNQGIISSLHKTLQNLQSINKLDLPSLPDAIDCLNSGLINLEEALGYLTTLQDSVDVAPEELHTLDTQLQKIYDIAKKHRLQPIDLIQHLSKLEAELDTINNKQSAIEELSNKEQKLRQEYDKLAQKLSNKRKTAAQDLSKAISEQLTPLEICGPLTIKLSSKEHLQPQANGMDDIEILVKTNPDKQASPIGQIASGGELSRINLAILAVTGKHFSIPTMIFDEVDVGISGATAEIVGNLLVEISRNAQIICITHLAQVASLANQHFKIQKNVKDNITRTTLTALSTDARIQEIARIIGGIKVTDTTLSRAKEMLS